MGLVLTVCSYPKGGTFTTKLDLKTQCLINHKTVFGTRNPAFWVGAVMPSLFFSVVCLSVGGAVGQAYSFASFGLCVGLCGLQMCMTAKGRLT